MMISNFCQILLHLSLTEPLTIFGAGDYLLTDVKKVDGTDSYIALAEETGLCQNRERVEDCLVQDFLQKGLDECRCTLYELRNYTKEVILHFLHSQFGTQTHPSRSSIVGTYSY